MDERILNRELASALIEAKWQVYDALVNMRAERDGYDDGPERRDAHMIAGGLTDALVIIESHIAGVAPELAGVA